MITPTYVTFLILGGSGDLAQRMLIPGIADYLSLYAGKHNLSARIIGSGSTPQDDYGEFVRSSLTDSGAEGLDEDIVSALADTAQFIAADATDPEQLEELVEQSDDGGRLIIYFALPPAIAGSAAEGLAEAALPDKTVLAMEKPFGTDAASAAELDKKLLKVVDEDHLFRVDHFLYESAAINMVGILGANQLLQSGWNRDSVAAVRVIFDESLGLEGRAEFYDSNGAARDMLQSHLIQTAAHVLAAGGDTSAPEILDATSVDVSTARRARYTSGTIDGRELPSYTDEDGVDPERDTETLVQVQLSVDTDQWRGVPITLRSGKAIGDPRQEISVTYRATEQTPDAPAPRLVVPFADELSVHLNVSDHSSADKLQQVKLRADLNPSRLTPYARVVRALVHHDHSAEVPAGGPGRAWEIVQPVLDAFADGEVDMEEYPAGSHGPDGWLEEY